MLCAREIHLSLPDMYILLINQNTFFKSNFPSWMEFASSHLFSDWLGFTWAWYCYKKKQALRQLICWSPSIGLLPLTNISSSGKMANKPSGSTSCHVTGSSVGVTAVVTFIIVRKLISKSVPGERVPPTMWSTDNCFESLLDSLFCARKCPPPSWRNVT